MSYGFSVELSGDFDAAIERVTAELKKEGFGIMTDINVQATLKAKLDVDRRPYRILGACNPALAMKAIEADPDIGLLLPCNVVVREQDDKVIVVSFMDPIAVLGIAEVAELGALGDEVRSRLDRVCSALG